MLLPRLLGALFAMFPDPGQPASCTRQPRSSCAANRSAHQRPPPRLVSSYPVFHVLERAVHSGRDCGQVSPFSGRTRKTDGWTALALEGRWNISLSHRWIDGQASL
ncbi:hypothetical protein B0I35DRAFT_273022 [Stachybotrys elegans]|uniref:Secreted protein n=1 Tax=Stachybotrys elegans TaxID=80388 RepID=A0A8K0SRK2_9HYPO|nr:hypothetical protein B0I35DRAFT_273022 [Stachybotrys elegans]